jgi:hypothetical protein
MNPSEENAKLRANPRESAGTYLVNPYNSSNSMIYRRKALGNGKNSSKRAKNIFETLTAAGIRNVRNGQRKQKNA